jgi:large subunit ribosomal protein L9
MKVIMLKDVRNIGRRGELLDVADGYALNFLIPNGFAEQATSSKVAAFKTQEAAAAESNSKKDAHDASAAKKLEGGNITIAIKANDKGHLYRQLSQELIASNIKEAHGIELAPDAVTLKEPIKMTGEFEAVAQIGRSRAKFKISVVAAE